MEILFQEVLDKKKACEQTILKAIDEFESETELRVEGIELERGGFFQTEEKEGIASSSNIKIKVNL